MRCCAFSTPRSDVFLNPHDTCFYRPSFNPPRLQLYKSPNRTSLAIIPPQQENGYTFGRDSSRDRCSSSIPATNCRSQQIAAKMVAGKSPPGWLPPGWKVHVKDTNGGKVKCYIEPLTGRKFYTKPQVAKYLKNKKPSMGEFFGGEAPLKPEASCNMKTMEGASCASEQKERSVSKKSIKKVVIERTIPDGLPTGWIKETKIEKRNGTRRDPYYTDPVSGYVFRSVPDALRYLESGDITECAIKPRKRHELSFLVEETSVKSPSSANIQHSGPHTSKAQLEGMENSVTIKGSEKRQCPTVSSDATILSMAEHPLNHVIEESAETACRDNPSRSNQPRTEGSKRKICDRVDEKNGTDKFAMNVESNIESKMLIDSRKTEKQEAVNLQRRSSKRLRGIEPEMVVSLGLSERDLKAAARNAEAKLFQVSDRLNEKNGADQFAVNVIGSTSDHKMLINSRKTVKQEPVNQPLRSSKRLMGIKPEMVVSLGLSERDLVAAARNAGAKLFRLCDGVNEKNGADQFNEKNGADQFAVNVVGSDRKMLINSRKMAKQEAVNLPCRSSKRLMGTKPEMVVNLGSSEQDLIAAAKNAEANPLVRGAPQLLETFSGAEIANHFFTGTDSKWSNGSNKPLKNEDISEARHGTEEEHEADVESKILNPVGDSWSDPCLDFAVKVLTGTIRIEEETKETNDRSPMTRIDGCNRNQCDVVCAENVTVSFPSADMVPEGKLAERRMGMSANRKMQSKSKKEEAVSLPRRFSNRLAELNRGVAVKYPLCQSVPVNAEYGESAGAKQPSEALDNAAHSAPLLFETADGRKKPMAEQGAQGEQPVRQETETKNMENPESQFLYPLDEYSWPDPCIEFAVKTLTGELPIEDNIAIEDYFQQLDDTSYTLPDIGLPNSFQTDILSDFDSKGNPVSRTWLPEIPTFFSPGNVGSMVHGDNALQQPILRGREERNRLEGKS